MQLSQGWPPGQEVWASAHATHARRNDRGRGEAWRGVWLNWCRCNASLPLRQPIVLNHQSPSLFEDSPSIWMLTCGQMGARISGTQTLSGRRGRSCVGSGVRGARTPDRTLCTRCSLQSSVVLPFVAAHIARQVSSPAPWRRSRTIPY